MADLIAELEGVVRLSERDSVYPGRWHWSANGNILTDAPLTGCDPEIAAVYSERDDDAAPDNAKLIIAAVNFLRTHHAEIAAAVRDSQRIDFLQREVDEIGAFLLHNGKGRGSGFTGLGLKNTGRTLRQAIDQGIDANAYVTAMRAGG